MVTHEQAITHDYCAMRSGGIERVQKMAERRLDGHGQKLDDLTRACIQLTAAVERVSLILEKQDRRLDRLEDKGLLPFLQSPAGKAVIRWVGLALLVLLAAGVGINLLEFTEVFG